MKKIVFAAAIAIVVVLGLSGCCSYGVAVSEPVYPYRPYYYTSYYSVYPYRVYYYSPYYGYYRPTPPPPRRHRHHRH